MCGIAGYFGKHTLDPERLDACSGLMRRRGPDDEGLVTRKTRDGAHLYLLHARLSIIDLDSRARQPSTNFGDILMQQWGDLQLPGSAPGVGSLRKKSDQQFLKQDYILAQLHMFF